MVSTPLTSCFGLWECTCTPPPAPAATEGPREPVLDAPSCLRCRAERALRCLILTAVKSSVQGPALSGRDHFRSLCADGGLGLVG